jgi:hypothetical protein
MRAAYRPVAFALLTIGFPVAVIANVVALVLFCTQLRGVQFFAVLLLVVTDGGGWCVLWPPYSADRVTHWLRLLLLLLVRTAASWTGVALFLGGAHSAWVFFMAAPPVTAILGLTCLVVHTVTGVAVALYRCIPRLVRDVHRAVYREERARPRPVRPEPPAAAVAPAAPPPAAVTATSVPKPPAVGRRENAEELPH